MSTNHSVQGDGSDRGSTHSTRLIVFSRRLVVYVWGDEDKPDMEMFSGGQLEEVIWVERQPDGRYTITFVDGTLAFDVPGDSFSPVMGEAA